MLIAGCSQCCVHYTWTLPACKRCGFSCGPLCGCCCTAKGTAPCLQQHAYLADPGQQSRPGPLSQQQLRHTSRTHTTVYTPPCHAGECARVCQRPVTLFARKGADCLGKYHGDAERSLRLIFEEAQRLAPAIVSGTAPRHSTAPCTVCRNQCHQTLCKDTRCWRARCHVPPLAAAACCCAALYHTGVLNPLGALSPNRS